MTNERRIISKNEDRNMCMIVDDTGTHHVCYDHKKPTRPKKKGPGKEAKRD